MTVLPLVLALTVGAKYFDSDPRYYSSGAMPVPLAEGSTVTCELCYSPSALEFVFRGPGKPAGRFVLQVRPGARNCAVPLAPFAYEIENREGGAVTDLLAPTAHSRRTPHFAATVETKMNRTGKGWETLVSLPFRGRLKWWPVQEGAKRPPSWYAAVRYVDGGGKPVDWGTVDDPLQITWGRMPPFKAARDGLFKDHELVEAYRDMHAKYCDIYDYSQKERWIGYLDPGVETFAWRQADSEKLFFDTYAAAIANEFNEALKLLEYGLDPENKRYRTVPPKSLKLADPAKERLFGMIDDFNYASDSFTASRLRYLNDRFMGRKMAAAQPVKPKKPVSAASKLKAPDASVEEGSISLDDDELQF